MINDDMLNLLEKNELINDIDIEHEKIKIENICKSYGIPIICENVVNTLNYIIYELNLCGKNGKTYKIKSIENIKTEIGMYYQGIKRLTIRNIPNKSLLGIFMEKDSKTPFRLYSALHSIEFSNSNAEIPLALGNDMTGKVQVIDLKDFPHILISGTVGTGKTTLLSALILEMLYTKSSEDLKLLLIDTKKVNLTVFNNIPNMITDTITDYTNAVAAIKWLINEMRNRYNMFSNVSVKDIFEYNSVSDNKLPYIILVIEDYAELVQFSYGEIHTYIESLIQLSRASGIYLILSSFRASTDIVSGIIKANIKGRIVFNLPSSADSDTVLECSDAKKLAKGEILFKQSGFSSPILLDAVYVSVKEIEKCTKLFKVDAFHSINIFEQLNQSESICEENISEVDLLLDDVIDFIKNLSYVSVSMIQSKFKIGYARAGRIMDQLEKRSLVSNYRGSLPREVLINRKSENTSNEVVNSSENPIESEIPDCSYNLDNFMRKKKKITNILWFIFLFIVILIMFYNMYF